MEKRINYYDKELETQSPEQRMEKQFNQFLKDLEFCLTFNVFFIIIFSPKVFSGALSV